jgi:hypothetical protein
MTTRIQAGADMKAWAVQWHSRNRLDGDSRFLMWTPLFRNRRECRAYIDREWGYIRSRPDLRAEPHGWWVPKAVRVIIALAGEKP